MEYVDEHDNCDEQQNCKNDANDEPCGYACGSGVFDDSKLNVFGHIGPANDLCTLGQRCLRCCKFAIVCNTVYDPSGGILCIVANECIDGSLKCGCIKAFNHSVTVGQLERTVGSALCLNENEVYLFCICKGERVCCEKRTCGNGDGNFLIINSLCGVYNTNVNIVCKCEVAFVVVELGNKSTGAVVEDLNLCVEAFLSGCGSLHTNRELFNGYVTVGVDVVVLVSACACKFNDTVVCKSCLDQSLIVCVFNVVGKSLAGESSRPLISGLSCVDGAVEVCKYVLVQFADLVNSSYAINAGELKGDFGLFVVYTEQLDGFAAELSSKCCACGNEAGAVEQHPIPTVANYCGISGKIEAENCSNNCIGVSICSVFILANESAVDVVVNNVLFDLFCIVLNSNCICGHCKVEITRCGEFVGRAFKCGLEVGVAGYGAYLQVCGNDSACFVVFTTELYVACCGNGSDNGLDLVVANIEAIVFNGQQILVNNGVVREVSSGEGYAFCGCCRFSNFYAVCINEGHSTLGACCDTREGKRDNNACVCIEYVANLGSSTKVKCEVVSNCAAQCFVIVEVQLCIRLVVKANNIAVLCICVTNKLVHHCNVHNNLVQGCISGKNEVLAIKNQLIQQCNGQLETELAVPVLAIQDNGVSFLCICINGVILAVYQITNAYLGFLGLRLIGSGLFGLGYFGIFGSGFFGSGYLGLFGSGFVTLQGSLQNNVACGHVINDCIGCNVEPAFKVGIAVVVINHLGEVGAYGQEGFDNNVVIFVNEGSAVNVAYVNGDIKAGSDVSTVAEYHIQYRFDSFGDGFLAVFNSRYASCYCAEYLLESLFKNYLCIKGNYLFKYECGVACVEVHEAVICNNSTYSGSKQTVCNADSIALNEAISSICIFYLVNYCGIEVCERIGRSCCILEQVLQIKVIACYLSELIDNIVNGVIEVTVDLCGQAIGDLLTGNCFKLFYKILKGRNVCECIYKVLCFEVVREVITGYSLNIGEENLCIARCENLIVCLAEESRIDCFENSNDLFQSQALCKRDEIIGLLSVNGKDLILDSIHSRIAGVCHLFEGYAENGCELGGNVDVCNELTIVNADIANLIDQKRELSSGATDEVYTGLKNEVNVDFLGEDLSIVCFAFIVGECKAYAKNLTVVTNVCKLVQGRNEIFKSIQQTCSVQLENVCALIGRSNYRTVELNLGNSGSNAVVNAKYSNKVGLKVELVEKSLSNAGLVNNLNELLNVNLGYESTNVNCSNETVDVNDIVDNTIAKDALGNGNNVKGVNKSLEIGYVVDNGHIAANCRNSLLNANGVDSSIVVLQASNNVCRGDNAAVDSGGNLCFDNVGLNEISIAVLCSQRINVNNLVSDELVNGDNLFVEQLLNVNNICFYQSCEVGEQRIESSVTKQQNLNVKCCGMSSITVEQFIIQICKNAICDHSFNVNICAINVSGNINAVERTCVVSILYNSLCFFSVHVISKLILNVIKQNGELCSVNVCRNACGETGKVCIHKGIKLSVVYILIGQGCITDNGLDVGNVCSSLNINTLEFYCLVEVNNVEEGFGSEIQSQIHQLRGVIVDERIGINVVDSLFNIALIDVVHQNVDIFYVGLEVHALEKADKTVFIYASEQFVSIKAVNQLFYVDISNDCFYKRNNFFLGDNGKDFFLGQNIAETATGRNALEQTLNVSILHVGQKHLGINGNGNVGRRYVFNRCLVCFYAQPIFSKRTDGQNSQNSYEC